MSAETDYIAYLETKVLDLDNRVHDLEAIVMLILTSKDLKLNADNVYLQASCSLYRGDIFNRETLQQFKYYLSHVGQG